MPAPTIYLHLQKTGGTSIRAVFDQVFGRKWVSDQNNRHADGRWVTPLTPRQLKAKAYLGHMSFGLHTVLGPTTVPYFTVMRDPIQREVSRFRSAPQLRRNGHTPASTVQEGWGAVYLLSGVPQKEIAALGEEHVELALRNLREHFVFVGDTSRMEEVGRFLRDTQGWPIELPLPHKNASGPQVEVTEAELDELRAHPQVQLDQQLYDRVQALGPHPQRWA